MPDGRFELELLPGDWTVSVDNFAKENATVEIEVRGEEVIDIGELSPGAVCIEGQAVADLSLESAQLMVMQGGEAELFRDGQVVIHGVVNGRLMIVLNHATDGQFIHHIDVEDELGDDPDPGDDP